MKKHSYQLVQIEWEDSRQPISEWRYLADYVNPSVVSCLSAGWLINDGEFVKVLAQNLGDVDDKENAQVSGVMQIPASCVKKIVRLDG